MNENEFRKFKKDLATEIKECEKILKEAIQVELGYGYKVELNSLLNILEEDNDVKINSNIKSMGIVCGGAPDIMLELGLMAIRNNIYLELIGEGYSNIDECIFAVINEVAKDMKIENKIHYSPNAIETDINNTTEPLDTVAFIGSYFDYCNFCYRCKYKNVIFWNDNNIKILMERKNFKEEYKNIIKTAYFNNVEVEVYEDKDEFIDEIQEGEFAIIYAHENDKDEILSRIKPRIIKFNEFKLENFKFDICEFLKNCLT